MSNSRCYINVDYVCYVAFASSPPTRVQRKQIGSEQVVCFQRELNAYGGPGFPPLPHTPSPVRKMSLFLNLPVGLRSSLLTGERGSSWERS